MARWPLTAEDRQTVVTKMMEIIASDDTPCAIRAMRVVLEMEAQNIQDEDSEAGEFRRRLERAFAGLNIDHNTN